MTTASAAKAEEMDGATCLEKQKVRERCEEGVMGACQEKKAEMGGSGL